MPLLSRLPAHLALALLVAACVGGGRSGGGNTGSGGETAGGPDTGTIHDLPDTGPTPHSAPDVAHDAATDAKPDVAPPRDAQPDVIPAPDTGPPPDPGPIPNEGWVGGPCVADRDCEYEGGYCLTEDDGYPGGLCALECDRLCPDREGELISITFCVSAPDGSGQCVSRCDFDLFETGCREGYHCAEQPRHGEPGTVWRACVPGEGDPIEPDPEGDCFAEAGRLGLRVQQAANPRAHPEGRNDLLCDVQDAVRLQVPVHAIDYRYHYADEPASMFMACRLALALHRLDELLREHDIIEVIHVGTYNCRALRQGGALSQHGLGLAIDFSGFRTADGQVWDLEEHWETLYDDPITRGGRLLHDLAWAMHRQRIFNVVLTPEYNEAHATHFHVDLTPGSDFLGKPGAPAHSIGTFEEAGQAD